jgi:transcriptional regulator with XRE-family HTH domain
MNFIQSIRQALGISQAAFATLVDCDRGLLSMAETSKRNLPTTASFGMVAIQNALLTTEQLTNTTTPHDAATQKMLSKHIKTCEAQLQQQQLQLAAITEKLQQAQQLLHVASVLGTESSLTETARLQWAILQRKAGSKLIKYHLLRVQTLIAINGLEAEITCAKTL